MATTINEASSHSDGGLTFLHLKLTLGAADTTATYTIAGAPRILMMTQPFKTTGVTGDVKAVYNGATGVLTFSGAANNDVIRCTVAY
jgi:hypothetical protein